MIPICQTNATTGLSVHQNVGISAVNELMHNHFFFLQKESNSGKYCFFAHKDHQTLHDILSTSCSFGGWVECEHLFGHLKDRYTINMI